jgi:nucleotide-binding universal stress UspA family protein
MTAVSTIVVGYDGSEPSRAAVQYAAERVGPDGKLVVVHATGAMLGLARGTGEMLVTPESTSHGQAVLDELMLEAGPALIDTDYRLVLVPGDPAKALVETAKAHEADEIALGTRSEGRIGTLLGSVAQQVLHTADRPVMVIPYGAVRQQTETHA